MEADYDYYEILGVAITATPQQISKAYRRKALKVHSDKVGTGDLVAAETFLRITKAHELLTDETRRAEYDEIHRARLAKKVRVEKLDTKRKQAREDLEAREAAFTKRSKTADTAKQTEEEIKRLREEGLRRLEAMVKEDADQKERDAPKDSKDEIDHALLLKWKSNELSKSLDDLETLFSAFGEIEKLTMLKIGQALLLYRKAADAEKIHSKKDSFKEFKVKWVTPRKVPEAKTTTESGDTKLTNSTSGFSFSIGGPSSTSESDILRRLRERQKEARA